MLVNGKKIASEILEELKAKIGAGPCPTLGVILVGQNPASLTYVGAKKKRGEEMGIAVKVYNFSETITQEVLEAKIQEAVAAGHDGIIVQLPLPAHIDRQKILDLVPPDMDVDCLTTANKQKLQQGTPVFLPPAPAAVLEILEYHGIDLTEKKALLVGMGELIGKPLAAILRGRGFHFDEIYLGHGNLAEQGPEADVIISGTGKAGLITGDVVKQGAVVIDAGTAGTDKGVVGDVDTASVEVKASLLSAVPGGVGPVTIAMLLRNGYDSYIRNNSTP